MNTVQQVITILATALPLLVGLVTFLLKFVKNEKVKRIMQETIKVAQSLQPLIVKAEGFTELTGEEKKQFVLKYASQFALENNLNFDSEKISKIIDDIIETTKKVNARDKDKAAALTDESDITPKPLKSEN